MQRLLIALCFLVVAIDGFDTAIVGFIAPAIRAEWRLGVSRLGPLFAAGLVSSCSARSRSVRWRIAMAARRCWSPRCCSSVPPASLRRSAPNHDPDLASFRHRVGLGGAVPTAITLASELLPAPGARRS